MLKTLDFYILKKFLGTFFFAIVLILSICVVFDMAEKLDDFLDSEVTLRKIVFDYYLNFIPYFGYMFAPLFVFISVIFFTSKMAYQSEIIAILSSGVSFRRLTVPYIIGAAVISFLSFILGSYIIPPGNKTRLDFEKTYISNRKELGASNIHMQIEPGVFVYVSRYSSLRDVGDGFSMEIFNGKQLLTKLSAREAAFNADSGTWTLKKYIRQNIISPEEQIFTEGEQMDTTLKMLPSDLSEELKFYETMTSRELNQYIDEQLQRGVGNVEDFLIEKHKRISMPFSAFILSIIGISLASRKVRGGMGLHIGVGIALSFGYILFMTVSTTFAINGNTPEWLAVWIPNFVFAAIAGILYYKAPK